MNKRFSDHKLLNEHGGPIFSPQTLIIPKDAAPP
jgi:hypothetical protein